MWRNCLSLAIGAFLVVVLPLAGHDGVPQPRQPPAEQTRVKILVAKKNLDFGTAIKNPLDLFEFKVFNEEDAPKGGLGDPAPLKGKYLKRALRMDDWVTLADLTDQAPQAKKTKPAPARTSWEYCELSWVGDRLRLETGEVVLESTSIPDLAAKLGHKTEVNNSTVLLNLLGADGWELVSHQHLFEGATRRHFWTFKRPVPPREKKMP